MKISYISLRKKLKEFRESNRKDKKTKEEKLQANNRNIQNDIDDTKYIGINYTKKEEITKNKLKDIFNNMKSVPKGSYTLLFFMILLLVATTKLNIDTYTKLGQEDYDTYVLEEPDVVNVSNDNVVIYQEAVSSTYDIAEEDQVAVETTSQSVIETNKAALEDEVYVYEYTFIRPVKGDTLKEYSMDKVIYSKTLDMWKVHDGIDIYAAVGEDVAACEKGIIERVYEDSFYGYSIIIDHQNSVKTIYRNLDENILVKEKEEVTKGQVIGKVGNTAIGECKDEAHIHLEVVKNGEIVNPNTIGIK